MNRALGVLILLVFLTPSLFAGSFISFDQNTIAIDALDQSIRLLDGSTISINDLNNPPILTANNISIATTKTYILQFSENPVIVQSELAPLTDAASVESYEQQLVAAQQQHLLSLEPAVPGISSNTLAQYVTVFNGVAVRLTDDQLQSLQNEPFIENVFEDQNIELDLIQSVPQIQSDLVWLMQDGLGRYVTGQGIKIAVIDTGVDYTQPDLGGCFGTGCKVAKGYDFGNNDPDPMDSIGHGTHVASIAAGKANGVNGLNGVAPDATIYAYKVFDQFGRGYGYQALSGIDQAVRDQPNVINMSFGFKAGNPDDAFSIAADNAVRAGIVVVVAAGNDGPTANTIGSPGTARKVITVGAVNKSNQAPSTSSRGPVEWTDAQGNNRSLAKPDVVAPGVDICASQGIGAYSNYPCSPTRPGHVMLGGTSMAAPHVAGEAALLRQKFPQLNAGEIKSLIVQHATDLHLNKTIQGNGLVNALNSASSDWVTTDSILLESTSSTRMGSITQLQTIRNLSNSNFSVNLNAVNDFPSAVSVSFNPSSLVVPANGSATYDVTFSIDNDAAIAASNLTGSISINRPGASSLQTPYSIFVQPRVVIGPTQEAFLGIDDPTQSQWTPPASSVSLQNIRTDASSTVQISSNGIVSSRTCYGISCLTQDFAGASNATFLENGVPTSMVSLGPGETKNIQIQLTVNNSAVPNKAYWLPPGNWYYQSSPLYATASIQANGQAVKKKLLSFSKCNQLTINASDYPAEISVLELATMDRFKNIPYNTIHNRYFCSESSGSFDVMVSYDTGGNNPKHIVKENISLNGPNSVTVNKTEAVNTIDFAWKDISGSATQFPWGYAFGNKLEIQPYWATTNCYNPSDCTATTPTIQFNNVSSNYAFHATSFGPVTQDDYATKNSDHYWFQYAQSGINSTVHVQNNPSDFQNSTVRFEPNKSAAVTTIRDWDCIGPVCSYSWPQKLDPNRYSFNLHAIALDQNSLFPKDVFNSTIAFNVFDNSTGSGIPLFFTPGLYLKSSQWDRIAFYGPGYHYPSVPTPTQWFAGSSPPYWNSWVSSYTTPNQSNVSPSYNPLYYDTDLYTSPSFDGFSDTARQTIPFQIIRISTGNVIANGTLLKNFINPAISLPAAAKYRFEVSQNYDVTQNGKVIGSAYTSSWKGNYDNSKSDKDAPNIPALEYTVNGEVENQANFKNSAINKLRFVADARGGTVKTTQVEYGSTAIGIPMQIIPATWTNGWFESTIPIVNAPNAPTPLELRVTITDNTGNKSEHYFELPITSGTPSRITNSGTTPIKGNLRLVVEKQNAGVWNLVQTAYDQSQVIAPNSTVSISNYFNTANITLASAGTYRIRGGVYAPNGTVISTRTGPLENTATITIP